MKKRVISFFIVILYLFSFSITTYAKSENQTNPTASDELLKSIEKNNNGKIKININYNNKGQLFVSGVLSDKKNPSEKEAFVFLEQNKVSLGINTVFNNFKAVETTKDELGFTHIKFNQYVGGLPIENRQVIVHFNKEGNIVAVTGDFYADAAITKLSGKTVSENEAIKTAKSQFKYNKLSKEPKAEKMSVVVNGMIYEVYKINIKYKDPEYANWDVYVETSSGEIVDKQSRIIHDAAASGTGVGVDGKTRTLKLYYTTSNTSYGMRDTTKAMTGNIITTTANHAEDYPGTIVKNSTKTFNSEYYKAAVDAHYYAGVVYDFYKNLFNRNSIDNAGMNIRSTVHVSTDYNNAFWDGEELVYGDGDGNQYTYFSGDLDVVAHEMTHGVTQYAAALGYYNQPGALNESYSDVFGILVQTYDKYNVKGGGVWQFNSSDWVIGDKIYTPNIAGDALRSLANPTLYNQPDNMANYENTTNDYGGIHINSGIPNKAAYLIAKSLGMKKTAAIYYRSYEYLNSNSSFSGAANAIKQAAIDLYGAGSTEVNVVNTAFSTVKILVDDAYEPNDSIPTAYAINAGTTYGSYISTSTDVDYYKINVSSAKNIDINLTNLKKDYDLYLYDSVGNYIKSSNDISSSEHINYDITTPGNYYIKVYAYGGQYDTINKYALKVNLTAIVLTPANPKVVSSGYDSTKVSWSAVSGATGYRVYRATSATGTYARLTTTSGTSFTDIGLTTGKTYYYKIRAYKTIGTTKVFSSYTSVLSAVPIPAVPGSFKVASAGAHSIKTTWSGVAGATGYRVYRATSSAGTYTRLTTTSGTNFTDTGLTTGKTYYYKVRAYKTIGTTKIFGRYTTVLSTKPVQ